MLMNPAAQDKAQEEIDHIIGTDRPKEATKLTRDYFYMTQNESRSGRPALLPNLREQLDI